MLLYVIPLFDKYKYIRNYLNSVFTWELAACIV